MDETSCWHQLERIALDVRRGDVYYTDLGGLVGTCKLDGSGAKTLLSGQGALTGITVVELPKSSDRSRALAPHLAAQHSKPARHEYARESD